MAMENWPQRLQEGSPCRATAIEELRSILFRVLKNRMSGRARNDSFVEDVVQDALLRILDRLDTFQGQSHFTTWALAIAIRVAFSELRRREWGHVSLEELRERQGALHEERDPSPGPDEDTDRRELHRLIRVVIESELTQRQRDVMLCELNGMPQEEIARQLGTNRNNVYKLFHDARKAIKRALESRGYATGDIPGLGHRTNHDEIRS